ncbi:MAG: hypothetical protein ACKOZL_09785 [Actinomycetes bacterium]
MEITNAYRNRWRRTWRSRVAVAGAGLLGVAAGAGTIAAIHPATSGATTPEVDPTTPRAPQSLSRDDLERFLFGDDDRDAYEDEDDRAARPQQVAPQWQARPEARTGAS